MRVSGHGEAGPEAITLAARVVSEALANADAHAGARRTSTVRYAAGDERLELTVSDDGAGSIRPARRASRTGTSA